MPGLATLLLAASLDGQIRGNYLPFVLVFLFGMLVAVGGHVWQARELVIAGIAIGAIAATAPYVIWG